jgi:alkylation response protein AidB-like acyl-CoA dehydrogenase
LGLIDLLATPHAAVATGIARRAITAFKELAVQKTPTMSRHRLAEQHVVQERMGRAEGLLRSGRAFLNDSVRDLASTLAQGGTISDDQRAVARLARAHAAESAAEAVDLMFKTAGASSIYATSYLERCFRDVHMIAQHVSVAPFNIEMAGHYFLGGELMMRR